MSVTPNLELARLVGSHHAYKAAGTPLQYSRWYEGLAPAERMQVARYVRIGLKAFEPYEPRLGLTMGEAVQQMADALQRMGEKIAEGLRPLIRLDDADYKAAMEQFEREMFYEQLRVALIPHRPARYLADRWPLDWTPQAWAVRFEDFKLDLGDWIRNALHLRRCE